MDTAAEVRSRPFDTANDGAEPAMILVRTPNGSAKVGVSREDASSFFESTLFAGGVAIISVSGWGTNHRRRPVEYAETLATLHQVYGPEVLNHLRRVELGAGAVYFMGLVQGDAFVSPTALQDAALAKRYDAAPALPELRT